MEISLSKSAMMAGGVMNKSFKERRHGATDHR
jgi:hypothetical protein